MIISKLLIDAEALGCFLLPRGEEGLKTEVSCGNAFSLPMGTVNRLIDREKNITVAFD